MSMHATHSCSLPPFSAEDAARIGLGAYYNALATRPADGPDFIGAWMLAITRKLDVDPLTAAHFAEIMRRWKLEENADLLGPEKQGLPPEDNRADNPLLTGVDNA